MIPDIRKNIHSVSSFNSHFALELHAQAFQKCLHLWPRGLKIGRCLDIQRNVERVRRCAIELRKRLLHRRRQDAQRRNHFGCGKQNLLGSSQPLQDVLCPDFNPLFDIHKNVCHCICSSSCHAFVPRFSSDPWIPLAGTSGAGQWNREMEQLSESGCCRGTGPASGEKLPIMQTATTPPPGSPRSGFCFLGWCTPAPSAPAILQSLLAQSVAPEWLLLPGPNRHVFVVGAEEKPPCPARVRSSELENRSLGEGVLIRPARHFRRLSGYSLRLGNQRYIFGNAIFRNKNLRIKHLYRVPRIARLTLGTDFEELLHLFAVNPDDWSPSTSSEHPA